MSHAGPLPQPQPVVGTIPGSAPSSFCALRMFLSHSRQPVSYTHLDVYKRQEQYRISDDAVLSLQYAKNFIKGKIYNTRWSIERTMRDYALRLSMEPLERASQFLKATLQNIQSCTTSEQLLGMEGEAASVYFRIFDDMILQQKDEFYFHGRNKRPPLDNVNAMLSFVYTLLAHDVSLSLIHI